MAIAFVTDTNAIGSTTGTTLVLPAVSVSAGHLVFALFSDRVAGAAPTIADSLGNTWTAAQGGTNTVRGSCWWSILTTGGSMVVTFTFTSSSSTRSGNIAVWSGLSATPLDVNPAVINDTVAPWTSTATGTLAQADELVIGYFSHVGLAGDTRGATSPFTLVDDISSGGASPASSTIIAQIVSSTASVTPEATSSASRAGTNGTISFKASAGGPTTIQADLNASAVGAVSFDGSAIAASSIAVTGAAVVNTLVSAIVRTVLNATGVAAVGFSTSSGTLTLVDLDSDGASVVNIISAPILTTVLNSSGGATATANSGATARVRLDSVAAAAVNWNGGVVPVFVQADFNASGIALVAIATRTTQSVLFNSIGLATVNFDTGVTAKTVLNSAGIATVLWNGRDAAATAVATFPYVTVLRRRRRVSSKATMRPSVRV